MKPLTRTPQAMPIVVCADDRYAMQLAVAVRSLLDTLVGDQSVTLYVLDGGISSANRERCLASWGGGRSTVEWICPAATSYAGLQISSRFPVASYFRISAAELLPPVIDRVILTDPDVLFLASPLPLLELDLHDRPIAAAQDAFCPFVDNRVAMANYHRARGHVCGTRAIPTVSSRSRLARQPYFNAGFMVMDLAMFRRERIGEQLMRYCRDHRDRLLWADQCALNACLGDRWLKLDDTWNVTSPVFRFPGHDVTHYDRVTLDRIRSRPHMIHFSGLRKPWHEGCDHPFVRAYWDVVARTSWRGSGPVPKESMSPGDAVASRANGWPMRLARWLRGGG